MRRRHYVADEEALPTRQRDVLNLIREHVRQKGYPPTIREMGKKLGIGSTNGVQEHLTALVEKGFIRRGPRGTTRSITLTRPAACPRCVRALEALRSGDIERARALLEEAVGGTAAPPKEEAVHEDESALHHGSPGADG